MLPHPSLMQALKSTRWTARDLVRNQVLAERSRKNRRYISRPLGPSWPIKYHPILAINDAYLAVGAGNSLFLYRFTAPTNTCESPGVVFDNIVVFPKDARKDISGIAFDEEGRSIILSFVHGALGRIVMPRRRPGVRGKSVVIKSPPIYYIREFGPPIRSLSVSNNMALTMSSIGVASLYSLSSVEGLLSETSGGNTFINPGWSGYLSLQSGTGHAVLGTSSHTPLVVHSIMESQLSPTPERVLSPWAADNQSSISSSVYSITGATKTFPHPSCSDQLVIAGWYHGAVTVHDLRCPAGHPVLTMEDPIISSAIYSVSSAGSHIAAGLAQHSVVSLFDVRSPKSGWSIYLPQGRSASSPVYSCLSESTRIWAATESHAMVVDFGSVQPKTYPPVGERGMDGKRQLGWHSRWYEHGMFRSNAS